MATKPVTHGITHLAKVTKPNGCVEYVVGVKHAGVNGPVISAWVASSYLGKKRAAGYANGAFLGILAEHYIGEDAYYNDTVEHYIESFTRKEYTLELLQDVSW